MEKEEIAQPVAQSNEGGSLSSRLPVAEPAPNPAEQAPTVEARGKPLAEQAVPEPEKPAPKSLASLAEKQEQSAPPGQQRPTADVPQQSGGVLPQQSSNEADDKLRHFKTEVQIRSKLSETQKLQLGKELGLKKSIGVPELFSNLRIPKRCEGRIGRD